jgi:peptidyl-prolyl cis-trans isomerase SurA
MLPRRVVVARLVLLAGEFEKGRSPGMRSFAFDSRLASRFALILASAFTLAYVGCLDAVAAPEKPAAKKNASKPAARTSVGEAHRSDQSIVVLVNDDPITGYEVEQRQRMLGLSANIGERAQATFKTLLSKPSTSERLKAILNEVIQANKTKTREQIIAIFEERKKAYAMALQKEAVDSARASVLPGLRKSAMEELIDERLKMQEAKKLNVIASDDEVDKIVKGIAERNKQSLDQFAKSLSGMGADIASMRSRFKATLSWNDVIRRKFGHMIAISERDIERYVSKSSTAGADDQVELQLQRVMMPLSGKLDQKAAAAHLKEAELVRSRFTGCSTMSAAAAGVAGAKFENVGARRPTQFQEPTRSMLLAAKSGEMLPAQVGKDGIELWAVCGRTVVKADEAKRSEAEGQLRQNEMEMLSKRYLRDLRQDASIEYR